MTTDAPKATKTTSTFKMACAIRTTIDATPERVWSLLTDTNGFPQWNSTVTRIEGKIAEGETLKLTSPSGGSRVFTPKVSDVTPSRAMTWSDGMAPMFRGVRTFSLAPTADGGTEFEMREEFAGVLLPMIKRSLPDFGPVFEAYAADLKRAAEAAT